MAIGLPPEFSRTIQVEGDPTKLLADIETALTRLGWKFTRNRNLFQGKIQMSWKSWGERFDIEVSPDAAISFKSVSSFPTTVIDWGKNEENTNKFFGELQQALQRLPIDQTV